MILELLAIIPIGIVAQFFHELGHYSVHKFYGNNPRFQYNMVIAYPKTLFQKNFAIFMGIAFGLIPFTAYFLYIESLLPTELFMPLVTIILSIYIYACRFDLRDLNYQEG